MKKASEFKRELYFEDTVKFQKITVQLVQFNLELEKLKTSYEDIKIGDFTNSIFKELISDGINGTELKFSKYLENELSKIKSLPDFMKDDMIERYLDKLDPLKSALAMVKSFRPAVPYTPGVPQLSVEYISYANFSPVFFISDGDEERILEKYCRIYLETKEEKRAYEALSNLCESYKKFLIETDGIRGINYRGLHTLKNFIDDTDSPEIIFTNFKSLLL